MPGLPSLPQIKMVLTAMLRQGGIAAIVATTITAITLNTTTIELGAGATDTTLARSGAGDATIEGNGIYRASGTDVAVADGGTGRSTATAYMPLAGGTTSTGAHQSIAAGAATGQALTYQGASALPTFDYVGNSVPSAQYEEIEHFMLDDSYSVNRGIMDLTPATSGAGASSGWVNTVGGRLGVIQMSTGTDTNGYADIYGGGGGNQFVLGVGEFIWETSVRLEDLSDGTDTYTFRCGLTDNIAGTPTDGVEFTYTHGTNDGEWYGIVRSNGSESNLDMNVAVAADTWYRLRFVVNTAASSIEFFINGTSVGTVSTNIPSGSARAASQALAIIKSAGTTARLTYVDYVYIRYRP